LSQVRGSRARAHQGETDLFADGIQNNGLPATPQANDLNNKPEVDW